jgi:hypothetical protein
MSAAAEANPQTSLYETTIDNPELEVLLENREKAKNSAKALSKKARDADAAAKVALEGLDLGEAAPVRIGRFIVTLRAVPSRKVQFETDPTTRLNIKLLKGEED